MDLKIRFWGVRGSKPTPGKDTLLFGGNTSCVEIDSQHRKFIFDGGTGISELGKTLLGKKLSAQIFFSHLHWDHIQGLPFFLPFYSEANSFSLYGQDKEGRKFEDIIKDQMTGPYFPISMDMMKADIGFNTIEANQVLEFDQDTKITSFPVNHPNACLAYKIERAKSKIIYATDTEPMEGQDFLDFIHGADVLIYDTHFTDQEYFGTPATGSKKHWGHSTWQEGTRLAQKAGIGLLVLYHHKEDRTDKDQEQIERLAQKEFKNTISAREGMTIRLGGGGLEKVALDYPY